MKFRSNFVVAQKELSIMNLHLEQLIYTNSPCRQNIHVYNYL